MDAGFENAVQNLKNVQTSSLKFRAMLDAIKTARKEAIMYKSKIEYTQKEI